ncbi:Ig-like domain-containing alpha-2-macroglobulin family protein [uncultured Rikenella sp.]|uniref:Ig-like domain-containing alpha-2-macroglobulin family protein n=1 Tax=uncultured Rikenella sp. TaxID=368003 RepID=UPI00262EF1BE|nr:Ig-like domain-containing alpha-2-macroglobulin family protein [uncultured Rikenella sp.]
MKRQGNKAVWIAACAAAVMTLAGTVSCGSKAKNTAGATPVEIVYNPLVESFTAGTIGRRDNVTVTLAEPVAQDARLGKYIEISPKAKGLWTISDEDARTLIFTPDPEFGRGTAYTVTIELEGLLPGNPEAREFSFSFRTLPAEASADLGSFTVEPDGTYTVEGTLYTADTEDSAQIAKMVSWDGIRQGKVHWMHSADGCSHRFVATGIEAGKSAGELTLTVKDKKAGYGKQEVLNVALPAAGGFGLHSAAYFADREKYIEVRFTGRLDPTQELDGLVWIDGINSVRQVEGNKVRVYPDASSLKEGDNGEMSVTLCVDASLRSAEGKKLGADVRQMMVLERGDPAVRFIGGGTVMPPVAALVGSDGGGRGIPFRAVGLRAVRVEVFRILENSVGQFLQENDLSDNEGGSIMRTARPVACKTIFLDGSGEQRLRKWGTYSLNLDELVKPEPGALYRISLSFDRSMAALPCIPVSERLTEQAAQAADKARFEAMEKRFDRGGYYWSGNDYDWSEYRWRDRNDPCTPSYYYNRSAQRNLLVTDLGAIAKASDEPQMLFWVHSIATAEPVEDAHVELRNFQGQRVGWGVTDGGGQVAVKYEGGRPYYAVVSKGDERTYLKVNAGSELSTSTFDVSGEQVQEGLRGFVWTERGVWRPGDTIYMNFVTAGGRLPKGHPVTVELRSPLGQLYQRRVATHAVGGIYSFVLSTDTGAPTGVWNATVTAGGATFGKRLRIETVKPNRLKIDLRFPGQYIERGRPLDADLHGEWLTGARAGGLRYVIETEFVSVRSAFENYKGYVFDNPYRSFRPENAPEITGTTDAAGDARITAVLNGGEKAGGMLLANITARLFEPSGEASVDGQTMLYSPFASYVGIHAPAGADDRLDTGRDYAFGIATVTPDGSVAGNRRVEVCVYKMEGYWWWSSDRNELARYVSDRNLTPVRRELIETSAGGKASYLLNVPKEAWGTYYVTARDVASGHEAAVAVYMDWPGYGDRHNDGAGAMRLSVSLDKKSYHVGDRATVSFPAAKGSRAVISVENGSRVLETFPVECGGGQEKFSFEVTAEMQPNVYLNVTLLQPYGKVENDLPVRLYGIVPLAAASAESRLEPVIDAPAEVLPETEMTVTVSERSGRACAYTLALVDEGLLDLTRFRTPDPWAAFHARVALGVSTWDIYNDVLGAYGGRIEQMFAIGGDDALNPAGQASVNRFPPVVRYLGAFELGGGQRAVHRVKLPAYMGRVRVMAVAVAQEADDGNGAWGSAERSVAVRAPLMVLGSAPRAVAPGDELVVPATLIATQEGIGNVTASIAADKDVFTVVGAAKQTVSLARKGDRVVLFRLRVKDAVPAGTAGGHVEITATGAGKVSHYGMDIPVRVLELPVTEGRTYTVAAGETWEGTANLHGMPGTQRLMLEVSSMQPVGAAQRMEYLSTYPYGCVEQITSAAFPLLYLPDLADLSASELAAARAKVNRVLDEYKRYATPDGSMGYWPGNSDPSVWGSAYALHLMTVAGHKGYTLPTGVYERLKAAVRSLAVRWNAARQGDLNLVQAYQLYVLALAGEPEIGAMNRLRQSGEMTTEARWMLAAAYAAAGRADLGRTVVAGRTAAADSILTGDALRVQRAVTYGSVQRAQAVQLLASSLLGLRGEAAQLASLISRELASDEWMSTQTTAWCMLATGEYVARSGRAAALDFEWSAAGRRGQVSADAGKMLWTGGWDNPGSGKMSVVNQTAGTLYVRAVASGISSGRDVAAASDGLEVTVRYTDGHGRPVDAASLAQGTDFVSEVTVRNMTAEPLFDLMLTEPVASGWEIRPDGAPLPSGVEYRDLRDDRADSYIPLLPAGSSVVVRTRLNAAYAGVYTLPAVRCSAMYDGLVAGNTASGVAKVY